MSTQNTTTDVNTKNTKIKEFFRKQCANIISAARIIAAISLYFFSKMENWGFIGIYVFCGLTDLLDGKIARKLNITSSIGALLDTIGDVLTYLAVIKILIMQSLIPGWFLIWYIVAMIGNLIAAVIAKRRFGEFYFIHSLFGKALGGVLFILPLMMKLTEKIENNNYICLSVICVVATLSAFETIYIQLRAKEKLTDVTSLKQLFSLSSNNYE